MTSPTQFTPKSLTSLEEFKKLFTGEHEVKEIMYDLEMNQTPYWQPRKIWHMAKNPMYYLIYSSNVSQTVANAGTGLSLGFISPLTVLSIINEPKLTLFGICVPIALRTLRPQVVKHILVTSPGAMVKALKLSLHHLAFDLIFYSKSSPVKPLCHARNFHSMGSVDVWAQPKKIYQMLKDRDLKWIDPPSRFSQFYTMSGLCSGASSWYNALVLKTLKTSKSKGKNRSLKDIALSTAKRFQNGVPKQGALLQHFPSISSKVLGVNFSNPEHLLKRIYHRLTFIPNYYLGGQFQDDKALLSRVIN